ncbi:MAG: aldose 1-epimerase family protein [Clostridia bacterium]|nr:aldose 1-epimerase family protein [Clostridia bacterium]
MKLDNGVISIEVEKHGAELKSAVKNGREYMWCGDKKYWGRTSPVLFPNVGRLKDNKYILDGKAYPMGQHGFARDMDFELLNYTKDSVTYILESDKETLEKYPFEFSLAINYTLKNSSVKVSWSVENKSGRIMSFSIGAHPAFNLKEGENYFKFDNTGDIIYNLIDESGFYAADNKHTLKNDGFVKIENSMFDNDALIIENNQAKEVSLCDSKKKPYVTVKFTMQLFGLWSPVKMNAPFVCIEPWCGRCDRNDFEGEISERDYIINLKAGETFEAAYEIELL